MNVLGKWNRLSIRRKSITWLSTLVAVLLDRSGRILSPTSGNTTPKSFPCRMWPGHAPFRIPIQLTNIPLRSSFFLPGAVFSFFVPSRQNCACYLILTLD